MVTPIYMVFLSLIFFKALATCYSQMSYASSVLTVNRKQFLLYCVVCFSSRYNLAVLQF